MFVDSLKMSTLAEGNEDFRRIQILSVFVSLST